MSCVVYVRQKPRERALKNITMEKKQMEKIDNREKETDKTATLTIFLFRNEKGTKLLGNIKGVRDKVQHWSIFLLFYPEC